MSLDCGRKLELTERSWGTHSKSTQKFPMLAFFLKPGLKFGRIKGEIKDFLLQINCANHCGAHIADYLLLNIK